MAYYDKNTWQQYGDNEVGGVNYGYESPTTYYRASDLRQDPESGRYMISQENPLQLASGDINSAFLEDYGRGGKLGVTSNYIRNLLGQGYKPTDFLDAIKAAGGDNRSWWGDQATLRNIGTGFDKMGKSTGWNSLYNAALEPGEQARTGQEMMGAQKSGQDDWQTVLAGLGAVAGVGGLAGAFGGAAATGGGGADLAAAFGDTGAGYGAGSATMGGAAGSGAATTATGDAMWGVNPRGDVMGDWDFLNALDGGNSGDLTNVLDLGGGGGGQSAADSLIQSTLNGGSEFGTTSAGGPLANGWQGQLANALGRIPNLPPGVSTAISKLFGGGGEAAGTTALSRLLGGTGTSADWASILGQGATGVLDYMGQKDRFDYAKGVDQRNWDAGADSRAQYKAMLAPGYDISTSPGYKSAMDTATETYLRKLSATGGNPAGIGAAPSQTMAYTMGTVGLPQYNHLPNQAVNAGGSGALSQGSTGTGMAMADASGGTYNSLGNSIGRITNPTTSLRDLLSMTSPV